MDRLADKAADKKHPVKVWPWVHPNATETTKTFCPLCASKLDGIPQACADPKCELSKTLHLHGFCYGCKGSFFCEMASK